MRRGIWLLSAFAAVLIIGLLAIFMISRSENEFQEFSRIYNLKLPQDTELIFSEDSHDGILNDGDFLYVFQLTNDGMKTFLKQSGIKRFGKLPLSTEFRIELHKRIQGPTEQGAKLMINATNEKSGYYTFEHRDGTNFELNNSNASNNNWFSCIVSTKQNRIYYYTYDS